jgi:hypothetical protein
MYSRRKETHIAIRADEQRAPGLTLKGFVSLSLGYDGIHRTPAFFQFDVLSGNRTVCALPTATVLLPTLRPEIHPGAYGIEELVPGILALQTTVSFFALLITMDLFF